MTTFLGMDEAYEQRHRVARWLGVSLMQPGDGICQTDDDRELIDCGYDNWLVRDKRTGYVRRAAVFSITSTPIAGCEPS